MIRRHLLAFALAFTAIATGCGGVETDQETPPAAPVEESREALAITCESLQGHGCAIGAERACYFSNGAVGMCFCQEPMKIWGCALE